VTDMVPFQEFVTEVCQIRDPLVAIDYLNEFDNLVPSPPASPEAKLSSLDMRIINSFHYDARRSYGEVATEVGASARTVRKHMERMMEERSIEIWTIVNPAANPDFFTSIQVHLRPGVDKNALGIDLMRRFPDKMGIYRTYCNVPDMVLLGTSHTTMADLNETVNELTKDDRVVSAVPHIVTLWCWAESWRDQMISGRKDRGIWPEIG
jgi:DNA-binding Lrp family transcriptional regulator